MDNGPRALCHEVPEEGERIDPGGVTAFERDLQRVLADQGHITDAQLRITEGLHSRQPAWQAGLASTFGAGARPSQLLT